MTQETEIRAPFLNRDGEFKPADWFQLVPKGSFPITRREADNQVRTYVQVVDDVACQKIHQAFQNRRAANPAFKTLIDFEHFSHDPAKSSEAACWINDTQERPDGVWARGEWSDMGSAAITNKRYRYLSPVWFPHQTESLGGNRFRPIEVNDAGLTNKPNLGDALQPFWNRAEEHFHGREAINQKSKNQNAMKDRLIQLFSMPATATEDEVFARVTGFMNRASSADTLQGNYDRLTREHDALKNRQSSLATSLVERALTDFAVIIKPASQAAWKNRLEADYSGTVALLEGLVPAAPTDAEIDAALKPFEGLVTAEAKPAWTNRAKADLPGTVALLQSIKKPGAKKPVHQAAGGQGASETVETGEADGTKPFLNRVQEIATERKLDRASAIAAVATEEPGLYADYRAALIEG